MAPRLIVEVVGDTSQLEKSFKRAEAQTSTFTKDVERAGRGATVATVGFRGLGRSVAFASGAFLGGAGLASVLKSSVKQASDLNEQISKTNVVFRDSASQVLEWSRTSATAMGLARNDALATASSFGALFAPLGLVGRESARQSEKLTQLGADLASFYNTDVSDALAAIKSGLVGESEPLRRYGVLLSETRVQQEALVETGKQNAGQLTDQEKVLARIALIYRDSSQAQGDFARTSEGLANQTRILNANLKNLETNLGQALVPGLSDAAGAANAAFAGIHKFNKGLDDLHLSFLHKGLITDVKDLADAMGLVNSQAAKFPFQFNEPPGPAGAVGTPFRPGAGLQGPTPRLSVADVRAINARTLRGNQFFDTRIGRSLDRVQDIPTLRGQVARLREISALVQQRINITNDVTRKNNLLDQLAVINREILADQAQIADNAKAAADKLKAKEDAARKAEKAAAAASLKRATERVAAINAAARAQVGRLARLGTQLRNAQRAREQRQQFLALGLTATGEQRVPTRGNLQAQLRNVEKQIAGGPLDTKAMESRLARVRNVLNDGFGKLTTDTRRAVAEFLDALAGKDQPGGPATKTQAASLKQLVAGTGLTGAGLRRLEFNLAGAHLTVPATRGGRPITVHTSVNLDGRQVARNTTEHQERDQRRRATQTRGRQRNK